MWQTPYVGVLISILWYSVEWVEVFSGLVSPEVHCPPVVGTFDDGLIPQEKAGVLEGLGSERHKLNGQEEDVGVH